MISLDNMAILECLEEKKALFARYEECTAQMNICEIDELQKYITERAGLANQIDKLNQEIDDICDMAEDPQIMRDAVANRGNYGDFPRDVLPVYDKASEVFTLISHIYNMEPSVKERMTTERANLLQKIKTGSDTAKVYNYVKNLKPNENQNGYFTDRKRV